MKFQQFLKEKTFKTFGQFKDAATNRSGTNIIDNDAEKSMSSIAKELQVSDDTNPTS